MFFSKKNSQNNIQWKLLNSIEQLDIIQLKSISKPQLIFKHSTRCSISIMAKNRIEAGFSLLEPKADIYYLDLLNHIALSNAIAKKWEIIHASPQLIVIKNGVGIYNASHNLVIVDEINKVI